MGPADHELNDGALGRKEQRRVDLELVSRYHEEQLRRLLENVSEGVLRYREGEIDVFGLDVIIHEYSRAARELWKFCGDLSGESVRRTARVLRATADEAQDVDWWRRGNPKRPE